MIPSPINHKHVITAVVALGAIAVQPVAAQESSSSAPDPRGPYGTLGLGASWPQAVTGDITGFNVPISGSYNLSGGFAGEIGAGYDFGQVRTELTYTYSNATITSGTLSAAGLSGSAPISNGGISTNSVLASVYLDIPTKSRWVPYVGGGLGYTNVSWGAYSFNVLGYNVSQVPGNQSLLGYQAKVGVSYLANRNTDVFVEGIYQGTTGFNITGISYDPLSSWGARLGARYRF